METLDPKLLEILACPVCKTEVEFKRDRLVCVNCRRAYPVRNGIPIMLVDEATFEGETEPGEAQGEER